MLYGLSAALLNGYLFGVSDHVYHLPMIYRLMDSGYLANDFVVTSSSKFGPQFYFAHLFAFAARLAPMYIVFAVVYLALFVSASLITAFAARDLTGSVNAGMLATVFALALMPFHLSNDAAVTSRMTVPAFLAIPFSLYAVWMGIRGQPLLAATVSIPAILVHPVLGLETAVISLIAALVRHLFRFRESRTLATLISATNVMLAAVVVAATTAIFWIVPTIVTGASFQLATEEFIHIFVYVRHPHHLLPSSWPSSEFLIAILFFASITVSLFGRRGRGEPTDCRCLTTASIAAVVVTVLLAFIGGYVLVELIPTRIGATAQTFRLAILIAWLGWILIAGSISELLTRGQWRWAFLTVVSVVGAPALFLSNVCATLSTRRQWPSSRFNNMYFAVIGILVVSTIIVTIVFLGRPELPHQLRLTAYSVTVALAVGVGVQLSLPRRYLILVPAIVLAIAAGVHLVRLVGIHPGSFPTQLVGGPPVLTIDRAVSYGYVPADLVKLAEIAKKTTAPDTVFLIPKSWEHWRLLSERAAVVDLKSFPFRDGGLVEWYRRHQAIYEDGIGYPNKWTPAGLLQLQATYWFDYAVLPIADDCPFPIVGMSENWKLVDMGTPRTGDP